MGNQIFKQDYIFFYFNLQLCTYLQYFSVFEKKCLWSDFSFKMDYIFVKSTFILKSSSFNDI